MNGMTITNTLLNAVVESCNQPEIITPYFTMLSQFHLLIAMPFSTGKSSVIKGIPNANITLNYTLPSIVGTINKEGDFINSALKKSANGVFVMDEAHRLTPKSVDALLSFLEQGFYSRELGYKIKEKGKIEGDLKKEGFRLELEENGFKIWVRFSCLWMGERIYQYHKQAFLSRFFPLMIMPTRDNMETFVMGDSFLSYKPKKKRWKQFKKPIKFNKKMFEYISRGWLDLAEKFRFPDQDLGYLVRGRGQMLKLASHFCRVRNSMRITKKDCEKALQFAELCLLNYKLVQLTPLEIKIFCLVKQQKMSCSDAGRVLGIDQPLVSKYVKKIDDKMR
tara:strand:- start:2136 stop:3140 length:1005 start_codon:yes stop_codon:yes gene_type:complete